MDLEFIVEQVVSFTREHQNWAAAVVFAFGFVESLALLSLLVPSTVILLGVDTICAASGLALRPLLLAGGVGASLGYAASYRVGRKYKAPILARWPFTKHPAMINRSQQFFERYGTLSIFLGHFVGPVRAVIPVIAGIAEMSRVRF